MIGIFGDSFAAQSNEKSWVYILKSLMNAEIENHAMAASSLQYSIDLFLKNHSKYDKIVFLTTHVPRLTLTIDCVSKTESSNLLLTHWAGLGQVEYALNGYTSANNMIDKIFDYFVWIAGDASQQIYHDITYNAYLSYIKSIRPDVILVPCFSTNKSDYYKEIGYTWSLCDISLHELQSLKIKGFPADETRMNHLSISNNQWFARHVAERFAGNFLNWDPANSFQFSSTTELEEQQQFWSK